MPAIFLNFCIPLRIGVIIVLDDSGFTREEFENALKSFLNYFSELDTVDFDSFKFQFVSGMDKDLIKDISSFLAQDYKIEVVEDNFLYDESINLIYDTPYMIPFIINRMINKKSIMNISRAFDVLDKQVNLTNEVFLDIRA